MALATHSKFYFGTEIEELNSYIEFQDVGDQLAVTLDVKQYTLQELLEELLRVLNLNGGQEYTGTLNRTTRQITIEADDNFKLFTNTGATKDVSAFSILGFNTETDYEGSNSYTGELGIGFEFAPQFPLQSYKDPQHNRKAVDGVTRKSTSGAMESISFGIEKRMECEAMFITNIPQAPGMPIRSNPQGLEEAIKFLEYATKKAPVEFMVDESKTDEFQVFILESNESDNNGLGFSLIEEYDQALPNYYRTGKLTWLLQENR